MNVRSLVVAALLVCNFTFAARRAATQEAPVNLALGKVATFDPAPNYRACTDPDDKWQLTDGKYASVLPDAKVDDSTVLWMQKGTVGWWLGQHPIVSFDLGQAQPISGLSFSTAAGRTWVRFPTNIYVGVSDDKVTWHYAGDLIALSNKNGAPPATGYATWRYVTHDLATHGRYVALAAIGLPFVFCDEIEIYRGPDALLKLPAPGAQFTDMRQFSQVSVARADIARRLTGDLKDVRAELASSGLPAPRREELSLQLDALAPRCNVDEIATPDLATFRAVVPVNDTDARILAVHGALLAATHPRLVLWQQHRYQWLPLLAVPPSKPVAPRLDITLMENEYRSDSFLLTNAGTTALPAAVKIVGPSALRGRALTVSAMPFTDTVDGTPTAQALPELVPGPNGYEFTLPAGLTTKLWVTIDSHGLAPGSYTATLQVHAGDTDRKVPLVVRVSRVAMGTPRLCLGAWDNTDSKYTAITPQNMAQAIALMRSHFVDTPWATKATLPTPHTSDFDAQDKLIAPLDWKAFDAWVANWPDSRHYFIFASVGNWFGGATLGTPSFDARVGAWAREFERGLVQRGLRPGQVGLSLVDEPSTDAQATTIATWEHDIKATAPEITLFEDPVWARPDKVANQAALTQADILSPRLFFYSQGGAPVAAYFKARQAAGQKLWFYQCSGPARELDPNTYYRLQAWHAFQRGALAVEFWSFSDNGGSPTSWDEYLNQRAAYTPVFLDPTSVTDGICWDAVREGVEDYEYLAMLRDRIATSTDADWNARAQRLLTQAPAAVIGDDSLHYLWLANPHDDLPDRYRLQALALLESAPVR